jgi:hypothetical protein
MIPRIEVGNKIDELNMEKYSFWFNDYTLSQ